MPITRKEVLLNSISGGESAKLSPITREEQYLAYIAGESSSYPQTPITREEMLLDKIAKNGISGGSSVNVIPLSITENGTYTAPSGVAYSPIDVNVASSGGGENKFIQRVTNTLTEITAEDLQGVTEIMENAFYKCSNLIEVEIPNSIKIIKKGAFQDCKIENVYFDGDISSWCNMQLVDNYSRPFNDSNFYCRNTEGQYELVTHLVIPDTVTKLTQHLFSKIECLESVIISDSVKSASSNIFAGCNNLSSVIIGNGLSSLGSYMFQSCINLKSLVIGSGLTSLSSYGLCANCSNLESVTILAVNPPTLSNSNQFVNTPIADGTGRIYVPAESVEAYKTATNWSAFADQIFAIESEEPTEPEEPASEGLSYSFMEQSDWNEVEGYAVTMGDCTDTDVVIPNTYEGKPVIQILGMGFMNKPITSVKIPDNVSTIVMGAFQNCPKLVSVTIGTGIKDIGEDVFAFSLNIESLTCKATTPPTLSAYVFGWGGDKPSNMKIYVPAESVELYKSATNWSEYADQIYAIEE